MDQYVGYAMQRVDMMLGLGVRPCLVFDGASLPAKAEESEKRREQKDEVRRRVKVLLRENNREAARLLSRTGIDVTHEMRRKMMAACRLCNIGGSGFGLHGDNRMARVDPPASPASMQPGSLCSHFFSLLGFVLSKTLLWRLLRPTHSWRTWHARNWWRRSSPRTRTCLSLARQKSSSSSTTAGMVGCCALLPYGMDVHGSTSSQLSSNHYHPLFH